MEQAQKIYAVVDMRSVGNRIDVLSRWETPQQAKNKAKANRYHRVLIVHEDARFLWADSVRRGLYEEVTA
jgi:hypothetical protein